MIELIGGILIGIFAPDWSWRVLLPLAVGVLGCAHLRWLKRRTPMLDSWKQGMAEAGTDEDTIADTLVRIKDLTVAPLAEVGLVGWKLYAFHFVWMSLVTLAIATITGLGRDGLLLLLERFSTPEGS